MFWEWLSMKKNHILLWIAGVILFVVSVLYLLNLSQRDDDFFLEETSETVNEVTETAATSNSNEQNNTTETLLENFGEDWLNFSSISERNQQVEKYMTEDAVENTQSETNENKQQETTGTIKTMTQDIEHPHKYILLGEKTTQEETREVILEVELTNDPSPKINHLEFSYKD